MGCRNSSGQDIIEIVDILIKDFELLHKFVNGGSDETVLLGDPPDQEETATLRNLAMQIKWAIEYFLSQLQEVSDPFRYDSYAFNVRRSRKLEAPVAKGSIVTIPANYYPGRDILFVSVGGTVLTPKKIDDWDDGERQYEEIGDSPNIQSNKIRVSFDLKAGDVIDVWVVASNLMREIATIAAMAQVATDKADEAKVSEETCKEILERIEKLVGTGILEMGVANIRIGWLAEEHVNPGGILKLPTVYYPTRAVLLLSYKGTLCTPKNPRLVPSGSYQYDEVGNDPTVTSNQVRIYFEVNIGDELDVWVCASAVGRNIEEIQAAKELACACAQQAEDIITNVGTSVLTQATFPVADNTVKAALDYLNPQTGEKSHVDIPIPLASPPATGTAGNAGLFPIESYVQLNTNTADIATLKGRSLYFAVHLGATTVTDQAVLQNAFISASGLPAGTVAPNGTTLVNLDEFGAQGAEYTWYTNTGQWTFRGRAVVTTATNTNLGLVKGTPSSVNAAGIETNGGKTFVEADGSMRLLGYDRLLAATEEVESGRSPFWSATKDYTTWASVIGSDGNRYTATGNSGPSYGGAVDPVTDTANTKWKMEKINVLEALVQNRTVLYINYDAAQNGNGTASSPFKNLNSCLAYIKTVVQPPFMLNTYVGYNVNPPNFYIIVRGTGDIVEDSGIAQNTLAFNSICICFQFETPLTSVRWTSFGTIALNNAALELYSNSTTTTPTVYIGNIHAVNSDVVISGNIRVDINSPTTYGLYVYSGRVFVSGYLYIRTNESVPHATLMFLGSSTFLLNGILYMENISTTSNQHGLGMRSSFLIVGNGPNIHFSFVSRSPYRYGRGIDAISSGIDWTSPGEFSVPSLLLQSSRLRMYQGTLTLGSLIDNADCGFYCRDSYVYLEQLVKIGVNTYPPFRKGLIEDGTIFEGNGRARESWPGVHPWWIRSNSFYY